MYLFIFCLLKQGFLRLCSLGPFLKNWREQDVWFDMQRISLHVTQNKVYTDNCCHESLCKVAMEISLFATEICALKICSFHVWRQASNLA